MSNTDGEDTQRIEDDVDGFSFSKGYVSGFEAGEKQLKETRKVVASQNKELASLREQLKQQEEVIRELTAGLEKIHSGCRSLINRSTTRTIESLIEKAKSLTTKDKCNQ